MGLTALLKSRRNTLLAATLLLLFIVAAAIVFIASSPTLDFLKPQNSKQATFSANPQQPNGPLFGISGIITRIDKGNSKLPEVDKGVVYIKWDYDETKTFEVSVSKSTLVEPNWKDSNDTTPKASGRWYQVLKEGQTVYLSSVVDLRNTYKVAAMAVKNITILKN